MADDSEEYVPAEADVYNDCCTSSSEDENAGVAEEHNYAAAEIDVYNDNTSNESDEAVEDGVTSPERTDIINVIDGVYVETSTLHGRGLFVRAGVVIHPNTYITRYPGERRRLLPNDSRVYSYAASTGAGWVVDAENIVGSPSELYGIGIAHLANSSHPSLTLVANCRLFISQDTKPRTVWLQTMQRITGPAELLVDYHWLLVNIVSCGCIQCVGAR
jgi:hypothetical protein